VKIHCGFTLGVGTVHGPNGHEPDPRRIRGQAELARELDLLRVRAAVGTRKSKVSLDELTRLVRLPRSTLHSYLTGKTVAPSDVLDRIVIALGASRSEQREWNEAWYRLRSANSVACHDTARDRFRFGLPARVRGFTGRTAELAALDDLPHPALANKGSAGLAIAAVCGGPGVGKTALASQWAHRVGERFPDGCLYLDLRGYDPVHRSRLADALAILLGILAPGQEIPAETEVRTARYRCMLAERKMLVLLDNALCADQVRPLLPGADSLPGRDHQPRRSRRFGRTRRRTPDTPRRTPVGPTHSTYSEPCSAANGLDADLMAAATLTDLCARLPLALRVAAERAIGRPTVPLADIAVIRWTGWTRAATSEQAYARFFRGPISVSRWRIRWRPRRSGCWDHIPASISPATDVAIMIGVLGDRARQVITTLAQANLIEPATGCRYRMHDLLRAYATDSPSESKPRWPVEYESMHAGVASGPCGPASGDADGEPVDIPRAINSKVPQSKGKIAATRRYRCRR